MIPFIKGQRGTLSIIGLLIAALITAALFAITLKAYFMKSPQEETNRKMMAPDSIDTSSYKSVLETTKATIKKFEKKQAEQLKNIENL